jgi:peroxiredoxin
LAREKTVLKVEGGFNRMARENVPILDTGAQFPGLEFDTAGGGRLCLPTDFSGFWSVILFCRGDWCRQDRQQLLDYELRTDVLFKLGIKVAAVFAEPRPIVDSIVRDLRLTFPVGYGVDVKSVASLTGAYYDDSTRERPFLHATGFLLDPAGKVFTAVYSSRSIGRITAQDAATMVEFVRRS